MPGRKVKIEEFSDVQPMLPAHDLDNNVGRRPLHMIKLTPKRVFLETVLRGGILTMAYEALKLILLTGMVMSMRPLGQNATTVLSCHTSALVLCGLNRSEGACAEAGGWEPQLWEMSFQGAGERLQDERLRIDRALRTHGTRAMLSDHRTSGLPTAGPRDGLPERRNGRTSVTNMAKALGHQKAGLSTVDSRHTAVSIDEASVRNNADVGLPTSGLRGGLVRRAQLPSQSCRRLLDPRIMDRPLLN